MKLLTRRAMAVFGVQRLLPAQLVPDLAAMTAGFIASVKVWVVVVHLVGCSMLPLVEVAVSVSRIPVVAIGAVCRCVFSHGPSTGLRLKYIDAREGSGCWTDGA